MPVLPHFWIWATSLPAPDGVNAILFSTSTSTVSLGRKFNGLANRSCVVPGAVWKVLHVKSKTGKPRLFDSFVKCEKKNHISLAQFYEFLSWAREDLCLWKWKKCHVNDLSTGNLIWDPVNSETEKFHPNPQMFSAIAEELSCASKEPPTSLLYCLQPAGLRKPRSGNLHQMLLKRVTDHD